MNFKIFAGPCYIDTKDFKLESFDLNYFILQVLLYTLCYIPVDRATSYEKPNLLTT